MYGCIAATGRQSTCSNDNKLQITNYKTDENVDQVNRKKNHYPKGGSHFGNFTWVISGLLERQSEHGSDGCQVHSLPAERGTEGETCQHMQRHSREA